MSALSAEHPEPLDFDPPLSSRFDWLGRSVALRPAPDGYPERWRNERWVAHPMDGRYFLDDYTERLHDDPSSRRLREAIERMADATVNRMEPFRGARVFWYDNAIGVRRANGRRTYSGLTQAYYARAFARAAVEMDRPELAIIADGCYAAIEIPYEIGGVLYRRDGIAIAQVPSDPRDLVLNGWLSSLVAIDEYAALRGRRDAHALVRQSAKYLAKLLPLYDVPTVRNSRYALTGVLRVELRFSQPQAVVLESVDLAIPGEGRYQLQLGELGHWESHLWPTHVIGDVYPVRPRSGALRANLVVSRVGAPTPNVLNADIRTGMPTRISLYAHLGRYDPARAVAADREWKLLAEHTIEAGRHRATFPLPWEELDLVVAPTNFGKLIGDDAVNSYHPIHVRRLRQLAELTGITAFGTWADRWTGYMREWATMPMYRDRAVLVDGAITPVGTLRAKGRG